MIRPSSRPLRSLRLNPPLQPFNISTLQHPLPFPFAPIRVIRVKPSPFSFRIRVHLCPSVVENLCGHASRITHAYFSPLRKNEKCPL